MDKSQGFLARQRRWEADDVHRAVSTSSAKSIVMSDAYSLIRFSFIVRKVSFIFMLPHISAFLKRERGRERGRGVSFIIERKRKRERERVGTLSLSEKHVVNLHKKHHGGDI